MGEVVRGVGGWEGDDNDLGGVDRSVILVVNEPSEKFSR